MSEFKYSFIVLSIIVAFFLGYFIGRNVKPVVPSSVVTFFDNEGDTLKRFSPVPSEMKVWLDSGKVDIWTKEGNWWVRY